MNLKSLSLLRSIESIYCFQNIIILELWIHIYISIVLGGEGFTSCVFIFHTQAISSKWIQLTFVYITSIKRFFILDVCYLTVWHALFLHNVYYDNIFFIGAHTSFWSALFRLSCIFWSLKWFWLKYNARCWYFIFFKQKLTQEKEWWFK